MESKEHGCLETYLYKAYPFTYIRDVKMDWRIEHENCFLHPKDFFTSEPKKLTRKNFSDEIFNSMSEEEKKKYSE